MLHAVGRALEPDFVLAHLPLSIRASARSGLPLPLRIFNGAATTTAPVAGGCPGWGGHSSPRRPRPCWRYGQGKGGRRGYPPPPPVPCHPGPRPAEAPPPTWTSP